MDTDSKNIWYILNFNAHVIICFRFRLEFRLESMTNVEDLNTLFFVKNTLYNADIYWFVLNIGVD